MRWKKISPRISDIFSVWMRWIAVNYLFSPPSSYSYKKELSPNGPEPLTSCMPSNDYSTAPTITYFFAISCGFKSDWLDVGKQMGWIFLRNVVNFAVNFCRKCGEMWRIFYFHRIHRNHRISYKNLPKNLDPGGAIDLLTYSSEVPLIAIWYSLQEDIGGFRSLLDDFSITSVGCSEIAYLFPQAIQVCLPILSVRQRLQHIFQLKTRKR